MSDAERKILEEYVTSGKLMQLSTLSEDGAPALCHVWYHPQLTPDRLYFTSRHDRDHSRNIRRDPRVGGGIVAIELTGLGQKVRGVTFKGTAREIAPGSDEVAVSSFVDRWPQAEGALSRERIQSGESLSRLYEVRVSEWLLFDEQSFPDEPRRVLPAN